MYSSAPKSWLTENDYGMAAWSVVMKTRTTRYSVADRLRFSFLRVLVAVLISSSLLPVGLSFSQSPPSSLPDFILRYLRLEPGETIRYVDATVDLNSDGKKEVLVYVVGRNWCGSGGCPLIILTPEASSYRVVTKTTVTRTPIRVLDGTSSGWRNLGVGVSGGGTPGYEAELSFDGNSYPRNPTAPPARRTDGTLPGRLLIPDFKSALDGKELTGR